jgi:thiaminase/transcriptional activator TenA
MHVRVKLSEEMWNSISDVFSAILSHPFIRGLVDGSLEEEKFKYYIIQDYHYLKGFSRTLAILASKSESDENLQLFVTHVIHVINVERSLHESFLREWKINPEEYDISPSNLLYVSYLLSTVLLRPYYEGVAVVLPCYWIYMEVGRELIKKGSPNKLYQRWIETYSGEEYEKGVREVISVVDRFNLGEEERRSAIKQFRIASIFEYMFWDSAYKLERFPFKL